MSSRRGRKPIIDHDVTYSVLERNHSEIFDNCFLRPPSHTIWSDMCVELGNKISSKALYISVLQDRHSFKTKLSKSLNIDELKVESDSTNDSDSNDS